MKKFFDRILITWITGPFNKFIRTGLTPSKLALSFSLGICIGINPILGTTTLICTIAAIYFRLNLGAIQLINYMVSPLQLLLIYPFIKAGAFITGSQVLSGTPAEVAGKFRLDWWEAISELGISAAVAVGIWALISIPFGIFLYKISLPVFTRIIAKKKRSKPEKG